MVFLEGNTNTLDTIALALPLYKEHIFFHEDVNFELSSGTGKMS